MTLFGGIAAMIAVGGHSVDVERPSMTVADDVGGRTHTWASVSDSVACWVQPASSSTLEQYGARDIVISHNVYFSSDPGVELEDRLLFGTRHLLVLGKKDAGELDKLWRIDCEETD